MSDRRRIILADEGENEVQRRDDEETPYCGQPENDFCEFQDPVLQGSLPEALRIGLQNVHLRPVCASNGNTRICRFGATAGRGAMRWGFKRIGGGRSLLHCLLTNGPHPGMERLTADYKEINDVAH